MVAGNRFPVFAILLGLSGVAIGVFKTGALALIGDISTSTGAAHVDHEHGRRLLRRGSDHRTSHPHAPACSRSRRGQWLYLIAGSMCVVLIVLALLVRYPESPTPRGRRPRSKGTGRAMKNPYVLAFSAGRVPLRRRRGGDLRVDADAGLDGYAGSATAIAAYGISIFFLLRAAGRFLGAWMLTAFRGRPRSPSSAAASCCASRSACGGVDWAVYLLPLSGLFMSVIYPTLNSKGISCLPEVRARRRRRA